MVNGRIPEEVVEQIRQSSDIVEVISDFVQLKKQGKQYTGLCPFHGENTPSFSVSPDKQLYHCFGCGASGNVFSFLMNHENYSFLETVQKLAERSRIELPENVQSTDVVKNQPYQVMLDGHELAAKLYHHILLLTKEGKKGLEYATDIRGFTKEQIEHFQIGVVPDRWDTLVTVFNKRNLALNQMVIGGLLGTQESSGDYYDRFRNRLMFPIWNAQGKVVGFNGRSLGEDKPKYLNSPETPIFHKGQTLYAFHLARSEIRKSNTAILFEGAVDVIAAWGAGIQHSIATLGTALSQEQAKRIRRNAEMVTICYDSDKAGIEAAFKASQILEEVGCNVKVALMPNGLDPDDYIKKFGAERFKNDVLGASLTVMAFKMHYLRKGRNLQDESERLQYIDLVLSEIANLPRAIERDHYLRQVAEEFSLSLDALKQEQYRLYREGKKQTTPVHAKTEQGVKLEKRNFEQKKLFPAYHNAERLLLSHMIRNEEIAEKVQERIGGHFNVDEHHAIAAYLYAFYGEGLEPNPGAFIQKISDGRIQRLASEIAMLKIDEDCSEQVIEDYIKQIENYPKWVEIHKKQLELKHEQDPLVFAKLQMEIIKMKRELQSSS
ncbi:DNA primase [Alkalihalobacillus pseudalcaliphilus]|uniref:DNA primase n=1 Tax=Alkalihalobacillus pseudalcaliphilus TaxID=79884 RepID=UPI00064DA4AC|nr:DNA primase [Alkalihalobacillus pseudalcaliphilus]KMK75965.1 DNA primase [Alkalihalobacillus pseudalcaliphilus]